MHSVLVPLLVAGTAVFVWGGVEAFAYGQATEATGCNHGCLCSVCGFLAICIALFGLLA